MATVAAALFLGTAAGGFGAARQARADGAFPNAKAVLLPADRPDEIVLATTFGLLFTDDGGTRWTYACESELTQMSDGGGRYILGAPPNNRIYAIGDRGVLVSADGGCSWARGGGDLIPAPPEQPPQPFDVFPDPVDPMRVFVLAGDAQTQLVSAYRSEDGGLTYAGPIFTSPLDGAVTGIESAATAPGTVYLTFYQAPGFHPRLATSHDSGSTWAITDIEAGVGGAIPRLAAVDSSDARKVYLLMVSGAGTADQYQALAITSDAGATWTVPLKVAEGSIDGFAKLSDGTLLAIGTLVRPAPDAVPPSVLFRSENGGQSFVTERTAFQSFGLGARAGTAFVATNNFVDGFALASSTDGGRSWIPRLSFREVAGMKECVRETCERACDAVYSAGVFPASVCRPGGDPGSRDGASSDGGGSKKSGGCGCGVTDGSARDLPRAPPEPWPLLLLSLGLLGAQYRRRPRGGTRSLTIPHLSPVSPQERLTTCRTIPCRGTQRRSPGGTNAVR